MAGLSLLRRGELQPGIGPVEVWLYEATTGTTTFDISTGYKALASIVAFGNATTTSTQGIICSFVESTGVATISGFVDSDRVTVKLEAIGA